MSGAATARSPLRWVRVRMCLIGGVLGLLLVGTGYRAYKLQVREAPRLRAMAEEQYLKEIEVGVHRGAIFDRHGAVLAQSVEVDSVYANPRAFDGDLRESARALGAALGLAPGDVLARIQPRRYFTWLKRRVGPEEARAVRELGIPAVGLTTEPRRFYPNQELAGPVLGYAGVDGRGLEGIELALDKKLRGDRRTISGLKDALGREVLTTGLPDTTPTNGHDVVLTIDKFIQFSAERALAETLEKTHAKAGTVIVLDPRTGDVLALATRPTLDPNRPGASAKAGARNRAVTDPYEPGSTMKTFSVAAAIEAGVTRPNEVFHCENGRFRIGQYTIHDSHGHGPLTVAEVLQKSSNIGAAKIARRLGKERLDAKLREFGFGRPTGLGLPGERGGRIRPVARWGEIGLATISFGQGITATPIQMLSALASLGNGGMLNAPRIVRRITDGSGRVIEIPRPEPRRVMRAESAKAVVEMLKMVTRKGGTATAAAIPGFEVAGKTGTAQKVDPGTGRYSRDKMVASFMGLVPADDPKLAMMVIIDEPVGERYGGLVAGPAFKRIGEEVLRYLGATANPDLAPPPADAAAAAEGSAGVTEVMPEREAEPAAAAAPAPSGEEGEAEDEPARPDEIEDPIAADVEAGEAPASAPGAAAAEAATAEPATDDAEEAESATAVPDFTGMSMAEALQAARRAGLRLEVRGSGRARVQSRG
ncbi:MAG TPA: penicillin-binding transpeptidase domain-containing protein, partial [Polyangia bacterium]